MNQEPPIVNCRPLSNGDWSRAETVSLRQAWLPESEPDFKSAVVQTAWTPQALLVRAELEDVDIFNPVTEMNAPAFLHGDIFEVFLRPVTQQAYHEIHVGPQNQRFQLRVPSAEAFAAARAGRQSISEWNYVAGGVRSEVQVLPEQERWIVNLELPLSLIQETGTVGPGTRWRFSFSRYDYTRGRQAPVLSSSSPHRYLDFHRQEEWGELRFIS